MGPVHGREEAMEIVLGALFMVAVCAFLVSGLTLTAHVIGGWLGRYGAGDDEGTAPPEALNRRSFWFGRRVYSDGGALPRGASAGPRI